ncbi:hypothetical protein N7456_008413 [Penicillium angulare]|uniref:Uncharacterized protein n=1 Tax=Penicillium angulare TaxID=116970 RepID=A0A9W9FCL9_9EURO|nr:hypothetical protein N7456_008413 [Penicillium angulare]
MSIIDSHCFAKTPRLAWAHGTFLVRFNVTGLSGDFTSIEAKDEVKESGRSHCDESRGLSANV